MLDSSRQRIETSLPQSALVLDVGGGASPLARADWVLDIMAYEDRGLYGPAPEPAAERFSPATWVRRDICQREPWPFADRQFDFAVCSHTLEDVRDPIWVCDELVRVARAGYIEVPSRLQEQSYGIQGPWVGWGHHRWLIDLEDDALTFVFKHHVLHGRRTDHFPRAFHERLTPQQRVHQLWWSEGFRYRERVFLEAAGLDDYLSSFVARYGGALEPPRRARRPLRRRRGP